MINIKDIATDLCRSCSKDPSIFKIGFDSAAAGFGNAALTVEVSQTPSERSFEF